MGESARTETGQWREHRRQRIVEAAERVFRRLPFAEASMDDIATEAHVGKPTIYRYFPSKDELFVAVFTEALDGLESAVAAAASAPASADTRFRLIVAALVPFFRSQFASWRPAEASDSDFERRRRFRARRGAIESHIAAVMHAGEADGTFRRGSAQSASRLIIGAVWGGATACDEDDQALADAIVTLFLQGIAAPGARTN